MLLWFGGWSLAMTVLWVALSVFIWIGRRGVASHDDLRESGHKAHQRIDALKDRCVTVEARLQGMPTHADLNKVVDAVARIGGDVRNMQGQVSGITSAMLRIENGLDTLMEHHIKEGSE